MVRVREFDVDGWGDWADGQNRDRIGFSNLFAILRRRQFVLASTFVLLLACAFAYILGAPPKYTASAVLMVRSSQQEGFGVGASTAPTAQEEIRISTTVELMKSRAVAERLALAFSQEFVSPDGSPDTAKLAAFSASRDGLLQALARLHGPAPTNAPAGERALRDEINLKTATEKIIQHTKVERAANSRIIEVTGAAQSPDMSMKLANGLVEAFLQMRRAEAQREHARRIDRLVAQVEKARNDLYTDELAVAKYMREKNLIGGQSNVSAIQNRIAALEAQLASAQAQSVSRRFNQLAQEEAALQERLLNLSVMYGEGHPEVIAVKEQLSRLRSEIESERDLMRSQLLARRSGIDASAAALANELRSIRSQHYEDLEAHAGLQELERRAEARGQLFKSMLEKLQAEEAAGGQAQEPIAFVTRAVTPLAPTNGISTKTIGISVLGALLLAILAAMAAEGLDRRVRSADHVRDFLGAPTLGMIPKVRGFGLDSMNSYFEKNASSDFVESMRNLFLELNAKECAESPKLVVVTSVRPGDGKTTVANGLAAIAAAFDIQAIVVALDRRGQFTTLSGDEIDAPVSQASSESLPATQGGVARKTAIRLVDFGPPNSASLPVLPKQLEALGKRWKLIIVEAPAILKSRDAKALAPYASDILVVMKWAAVQPGALRAVRRIFDRAEIGAVINRVNFRAHARLGYGDAIEYVLRRA